MAGARTGEVVAFPAGAIHGKRMIAPVLVSAAEMRALEQAAVAAGTTENALMEEAGAGLAAVVRQFWPRAGAAIVFCGKGHNAGDACVLARHLLRDGWQVELRAAWPAESWRPLASAKLADVAGHVKFRAADDEAAPPARPLLLVDGMLGTGAGGPLREPLRAAARTMNLLRSRMAADSLAIDLPSGLDASAGAANEHTVRADVTATLGYPKHELIAPGVEDWTGRLAVVPLSLPAPDNAAGRPQFITPVMLRPLMERRAFSMHKGQAGRIGIVAGSRGLTGAARLAAAGAVAAGGGLVTLFCPHDVYEVLAAACPPEVMVRPVHSCREVMDFNLDAVGIGPGMGGTPTGYIARLLRDDPRPVVIDADALNVMSAHGISLEGRTGGARLLTPHPRELARLAARFASAAADPAAVLAAQMNAVVLRKAARSAVLSANHAPQYNTTGHPMMAKGGFGDILTGFATAFLARGLSASHAAALASWVLGKAAEEARRTDCDCPEAFTPARLLETTGPAFASLRAADCF